MDKEFKEERENHVGRMIHMLSHQLKRRGAVPEMETGLTQIHRKRDPEADGEEWFHLPQKRCKRRQTQTDCPD